MVRAAVAAAAAVEHPPGRSIHDRRRRPRARPAAHPRGRAGRAPRLRRRPHRRRAARRCTATWCSSAGSTSRPPRCSGRASWACGPRCSARRPPRSAPAGRCAATTTAFPTYREHGVAWTRGVDPLNLLGLFRGVDQRRLGPGRAQLRTSTRSSSAPDACTRPATRWAMPARRRRRRRHRATSATAPPARATSTRRSSSPRSFNAPVVFFCQNNQWAISEPLEKQTRVPLYQRAAGFGFPGVRVDGNDVLAVLAVTQGGPGPRPRRAGPDARRGVHLPDGRAHHLRRPHPLPARRRARGVEAQGPDRAGARLPGARNGLADQAFFDAVEAEARGARRASPRGGAARCPTRTPTAIFDARLRRAARARRRGARAVRRRTTPRSTSTTAAVARWALMARR